ncbi:hypothetical protein HT031_003836 [Scenedesmus sp. PABB004]|nr:hypothetical protein HT031_003836 [Scenedesmus sp. PABB004]
MRATVLVVLLVAASGQFHGVAAQGACAKETVDRGLGAIPTACPQGQLLQSGLCYSYCSQDWPYGVYLQEGRCYSLCPPGYTDSDPVGRRGLTCSQVATTCPDGSAPKDGVCAGACPPGFSRDAGGELCRFDCINGLAPDPSAPEAGPAVSWCAGGSCSADEEDVPGLGCLAKCEEGDVSAGVDCLGACPDGFAPLGATCFRAHSVVRKPCCCTQGVCCSNCQAGYEDRGCTCEREAQIVPRPRYARAVRPKPLPTPREVRFPKPVSVVNVYSKQVESMEGRVPTVCEAGKVLESGLCWASCPEGHVSLLNMCTRRCPPDYVDCGQFCAPPGTPFTACAELGAAALPSCAGRYRRGAGA